MKNRSIRLRLNDILRAIDGAAATIGTNDFDTFRSIKLKYPDIPWQPIAGIGSVLRHDYDIVDERIIWEVATVHFTKLRSVIVELKSQMPEEEC